MKRIIDGVTYNTDTSTRLARSEYKTAYNHEDRHCEGDLFQTRGGAFFVWETIYLDGIDDDGDPRTRDRFEALSAKDAEKWIMTGDVEVFHNPFGEPPEAVAETAPGATIYLRVPALLKNQIDEAARKDSLSTNAWVMKCTERCLSVARAEESPH